MEKTLNIIKDGAVKGIKTVIMLLKIMIPIYILVVLLKHSFIMPFLERGFAPAMKIFGLPGEAAIPIITGIFSDEYAAVAALEGFSFDQLTVTTVAMIILSLHSLPVESAVNKKLGFPVWRIILFRVGLAVTMGLLCRFLGGVFL